MNYDELTRDLYNRIKVEQLHSRTDPNTFDGETEVTVKMLLQDTLPLDEGMTIDDSYRALGEAIMNTLIEVKYKKGVK